jgi:hypothetical protein
MESMLMEIPMAHFKAYVDPGILPLMAGARPDGLESSGEGHAMLRVWRLFSEGVVQLAASNQEMERDLILWLNEQGCCITDTLRAMEGIAEFGAWMKDDRRETAIYKKMIFYFEELDSVGSAGATGGLPDGQEGLLTDLISDLSTSISPGFRLPTDREELHGLLRECLAALDQWYTASAWSDLKRTDYGLNWVILEDVLKGHGLEPSMAGAQGRQTRGLFGLLNRSVGLSKKSCGRLPMSESHVEFILKTVLQKYLYRPEERLACHMRCCVAAGIPFYLTADKGVLKFLEHREGPARRSTPSGVEIISPSRFLSMLVGAAG